MSGLDCFSRSLFTGCLGWLLFCLFPGFVLLFYAVTELYILIVLNPLVSLVFW